MANSMFSLPSFMSLTSFSKTVGIYSSGNWPLEKTVRREVLPQPPLPTITSFLRFLWGFVVFTVDMVGWL